MRPSKSKSQASRFEMGMEWECFFLKQLGLQREAKDTKYFALSGHGDGWMSHSLPTQLTRLVLG